DDVKKAINEATASLESADAAMALAIAEMKESIETAQGTIAVLTGELSDEAAARKNLEATLNAADVNLQLQITALQAFQAAVEEADYQSQIDELKKYMDTDTAASYDTLAERIEAVNTALSEELDAVKASIATNTADIAALQASLKELSDSLVEINPNLDAITVLVETGVTSIELMYSYSMQTGTDEEGNEVDMGTDLRITIATQQANVFAQGIANAITFTKGELYQIPCGVVVRVSPVNATLTADMIRFVNSQGGTLDDLIEVTKVEKYSKLLTKASAAETGLWNISIGVKGDATQEAFDAVTLVTNEDETTSHILFAIQANNTLDNFEGRYATSTYDLTMTWEDYVPASQLYYNVGDMFVNEIANRYKGCEGNAFLDTPATTLTRNELTWLESTDAAYDKDKYPTPAVEAVYSDLSDETTYKNVKVDDSDNRTNGEILYPAVVGKSIVITLKQEVLDENGNGTGKYEDAQDIRALYVTLDYEDNAVESLPSEWNAWDGYTYEGLNTVVEGNTATIKVTSAEADGDIIGFRVYAVNYDGTLVDPDGKAFYVALGDASNSWNAVTTTIVPKYESIYDTPSDSASISISKSIDAGSATISYTWTTDGINDEDDSENPVYNIVMLNKDNKIVAYTKQGELVNGYVYSSLADIDFTKVTKIYTTILSDINDATSSIHEWVEYVDNQAYAGTLTIKNEDANRTLATLNVSMTKALPTGMPTQISVKTNQLYNGKYYAFLIPDDWAADAASTGTMGMDQIFNFVGANEVEDPEITSHYQILFATSELKNKAYTETKTVNGDSELKVDAVLVDNTTYHTTTVTYNYGKISSKTPTKDYSVSGETFETMYVSIYYEGAYEWAWSKSATTSFVYGADISIATSTILGTSAKDSNYDANGLNSPYKSSLEIESATLTTTENGIAEYYDYDASSSSATTLVFTQKSTNTNITDKVASTLTVTCHDSYGNPVVITLPLTITVR
ncbi:MAG: apolipoprotein A1/A4/E family protein, partial [Prevotellaceae bacterium]|nr:apolipoprotein A1/A4/E family protein [Prevotellaceae bacterium]